MVCHEVLSDFNCCQESYVSTKQNHTILLREPFHSFLVLLQSIFIMRKIIGRRCMCFQQRTCGNKLWVWLSCHKSHRSYMASFVFVTQIWDCTADTELINRNNSAKVTIVPSSAQKCIDKFPPPVLLCTPLGNGLVARKTGCPISSNFIIINSATLSHSPRGLSQFKENTTLLLIQIRRMTIVLLEISLHREKRVENWLAFYFVVSWTPYDVIEHRHEDDPSCEFCSIFPHFWQELLDFVAELQCGESCENIPLECLWLTIIGFQTSILWWTLEPRQLVFPNSIWKRILVQLSKA